MEGALPGCGVSLDALKPRDESNSSYNVRVLHPTLLGR
jgi:hypothetical protein